MQADLPAIELLKLLQGSKVVRPVSYDLLPEDNGFRKLLGRWIDELLQSRFGWCILLRYRSPLAGVAALAGTFLGAFSWSLLDCTGISGCW